MFDIYMKNKEKELIKKYIAKSTKIWYNKRKTGEKAYGRYRNGWIMQLLYMQKK
jgi:hypothetical protein